MTTPPRVLEVWADWADLGGAARMGTLRATPSRGKEIFAFEFAPTWLASKRALSIDPQLQLYRGLQYAPDGHQNFGVFLDSCPDRWGRVLMRRREARLARNTGISARTLLESDYLLGVFDRHRMGALRFRLDPDGPFLDDQEGLASPPWTSLRQLEHASLAMERDDAESDPDYDEWLRLLLAPGASLGGARPKADVVDPEGRLWIAKFPSLADDHDTGAWEHVVHGLARDAGVAVPDATSQRFASKHHTFCSLRFDRTDDGGRVHFASALPLLGRRDGDDAALGASYLELAEFIGRHGARAPADLEQLWRRIVFFICVSNIDDHLRNHGFVLGPKGWSLSPAYDINPTPTGTGLTLNISETDNALDLDLALEVAGYFRVKAARATEIVEVVVAAVRGWRAAAKRAGISASQSERMAGAFRAADRQRPGRRA